MDELNGHTKHLERCVCCDFDCNGTLPIPRREPKVARLSINRNLTWQPINLESNRNQLGPIKSFCNYGNVHIAFRADDRDDAPVAPENSLKKVGHVKLGY